MPKRLRRRGDRVVSVPRRGLCDGGQHAADGKRCNRGQAMSAWARRQSRRSLRRLRAPGRATRRVHKRRSSSAHGKHLLLDRGSACCRGRENLGDGRAAGRDRGAVCLSVVAFLGHRGVDGRHPEAAVSAELGAALRISRLRIDFRQFVVDVEWAFLLPNPQAASGVSMARSVNSVCMSIRIRS